MCYWSFITVHNRCVERVAMDHILGCPLFWAAQETAPRLSSSKSYVHVFRVCPQTAALECWLSVLT